MRRRVTDDLEAFGVFLRDDRELRIVVDDVGSVDDLAVDLAGGRRLGEAGTDGRRDVLDGDRRVVLAYRAVGKCDGNHDVLAMQGGLKSAAMPWRAEAGPKKTKRCGGGRTFRSIESRHGRADAFLR